MPALLATHHEISDPKKNRMVFKMLTQLIHDEDGATAIEYGLLIALIAIVLIGALTAIGSGLTDKFTTINDALDS